MEIKPLSKDYAVTPQISAGDLTEIAAAGFTTVICNRPDQEIPPAQQSDLMAEAAKAAGLQFVFLPITYETLDDDAVARQAAAMADAAGPVLAYCASGTRSSVVWSFSQVGDLTIDEIIAATTRAGYQLGGLRPQLEAIAART